MEITKYFKVSFIALVTAVLISCGGGGGGAGGPSYNGITTQAVVDSTNDEAFSDTAYIGAGSGSALGSIDGGNSNNGSSLKGFAKSFGAFVKNFDVKSNVAATPNAAVLNNEMFGECGGSAVYSANLDEATGEFSGSISFNNLDDCDGVVNGSVTYAGNVNGSFSMTFSNLSFSDNTNSIVMNGTVTATENGLETTVVMNVDFSDNNRTYRVENLTIVSTRASMFDYSTSDVITGRVYHPDYGYVEVTTPTPVYTPELSMYPISGQVVMTGVDSIATVTFNIDGYDIAVDDAPLGSIDTIKNCTWEPDECIASAP